MILGDGELQEGQLWEAVLFAGSTGLSNLCLIIDDNRMQVEGHIDKVVSVAPIAEKFTAFGWAAEEIDGHDIPPCLAGSIGRASATNPPAWLQPRSPARGAFA